jgi:hypothetical protein
VVLEPVLPPPVAGGLAGVFEPVPPPSGAAGGVAGWFEPVPYLVIGLLNAIVKIIY